MNRSEEFLGDLTSQQNVMCSWFQRLPKEIHSPCQKIYSLVVSKMVYFPISDNEN